MKYDLTGSKFGKLTVIERNGRIGTYVMWKCQCDCGNIVNVRSSHLLSGHTTSCGCYKKVVNKKPNEYDLSNDYGICFFNNGGFFIFDKEDYEKIKDYTWCKKDNGYVINSKMERLHRIIMNCPNDKVIDHINHNPLDNRKSNLRICSQMENSYNMPIPSNNKSGCRGVGYDKSCKLWKAKIQYNRKLIYLGGFKTKEEAVRARKEAERKYYGDFAFQKGH